MTTLRSVCVLCGSRSGNDPAYAAEVATRYFDLALAHGTTSMCSYATIHPASVDAFFDQAQARGLRAFAGKTCMDRNANVGRVSPSMWGTEPADLWSAPDENPRPAPVSTIARTELS